MSRPTVILEVALLLGLALIAAGLSGYDWRLACVVVGALLLALFVRGTWRPAAKRQ